MTSLGNRLPSNPTSTMVTSRGDGDVTTATVATQTERRKRRKGAKRCCRWMLAATFRSCFGPCFKKFGSPTGYDNIADNGDLDSLSGGTPNAGTNNYASLASSPGSRHLNYRSKSTSEIFRSDGYCQEAANGGIRPDKRSFSASFGYLDSDLLESMAPGLRDSFTSTNDMRSDVSEAFWSCRGSISRSSTRGESDIEYYSDESEDMNANGSPLPICEGCGLSGKHHDYNDQDKCAWRENSLTSSLPIPKSEKWIQLE